MSSRWNFDQLHDLASAQDVLKWPASSFAHSLLSSEDDRVTSFLDSLITTIWVYHASTHDYLLLLSSFCGREIWLRTERHPGSYSGGVLFLSFADARARDTVSISYDIERLKAPRRRDRLIMASILPRIRIRHFVDLLQIINLKSPAYGMGSHNCWWFANVIIGVLHAHGGGSWMTAPDRNLVKTFVRTFGRDTKEKSENVGAAFAEKWPMQAAEPGALGQTANWTQSDPPSLTLIIPHTSPQRGLLGLPGFLRRSGTDESAGALYTATESPRIEWELSSAESEYFPPDNLPRDTHTLDSLVRRVMTRAEPGLERVLLTVYGAFTSGRELLNALKIYHEETQGVQDPERVRIQQFLGEWAKEEYLDMTVLRDLVDWLEVHKLPIPDGAQARLCVRGIHRTTSIAETASSTRIPRDQRNNQTISGLRQQDIEMLALELRANEYSMRSGLHPLDIMAWLGGQPETPTTHGVFRTGHQLYLMVLRMILVKDITARCVNYQQLVRLAKECLNYRNFASAKSLIEALGSPLIDRLTWTRKLAGMDKKLEKIRQKLPASEAAPLPNVYDDGALYSLDRERQTIINLYRACYVDGIIHWQSCQELCKALDVLSPSPTPPTPNHTQLYDFLAKELARPETSESFEELGARIARSDHNDYLKSQRRNT